MWDMVFLFNHIVCVCVFSRNCFLWNDITSRKQFLGINHYFDFDQISPDFLLRLPVFRPLAQGRNGMQALETKVSWLEKIAGPSEFPTSSNEFRFCCPSCYIRSQSQIDDRGWVSLACFGKLWGARSRLYRSQILQVNSKYSLESSCRDLHNALLCTVLWSQNFR